MYVFALAMWEEWWDVWDPNRDLVGVEESRVADVAAAALCSKTSSKVGGGVLQQLGTTPAHTYSNYNTSSNYKNHVNN